MFNTIPTLCSVLFFFVLSFGVMAENCAEQCHILKPYQQGMKSNPHHLSHQHFLASEMVCEDCHQQSEEQKRKELALYQQGQYEHPFYPRQYDDAFCMDCHDSREELVKSTAHLEKLTRINPHVSRHNRRSECYNCHKAHRRSRFICSECHAADWEALLGSEWQIIRTH